jgi:putative integral membrane protein (TIGR02587 family)
VAVAARAANRDDCWRREVDDLLRGLTGGFLIGVPLLYTMETWWIGETISPLRALVFLAVAYGLNLGFVAWAGFRRREAGPADHLRAVADALDATALAIVAAAATLVLLHQIQLDHPPGVIVGRIAVNAVPISLGVAIANHILGAGAGRADPGAGEGAAETSDEGGRVPATLLDLGAAFAGALFLCFAIAPTEELPMLATEVPTWHLPAIVGFSLLLTYGIVFVAGFGDQPARIASAGLFQRPLTETVAAYLTSLATAAGLLWLFGQIDPGTDPVVAYAEIVLLGLPAAIGSAAGRLAV